MRIESHSSKCLICLSFFLCIFSIKANAQLSASASLSGFWGTADKLPFWSSVNKYGLMPESSGGLVYFSLNNANLFDRNRDNTLRLDCGISAALSLSKSFESSEGLWYNADKSCNVMIDKLFLKASWKKIHLDVGMNEFKNASFVSDYDISSLNEVTVSQGDIAYSNNARNMPGYLIHSDMINIPFTKGTVGISGSFGDYKMVDNRYMTNVFVHQQSLYLHFRLFKRILVTAGLEDWAQWGGNKPDGTEFPSDLRAYWKVMTGQSGAEDASVSDQINALGNHLGRELFRVIYEGDSYDIMIQHDIPFNDGSGLKFRNFPDGANTIHFSFKNKEKWITDIAYEFYYTKWQSGEVHDRAATEEEIALHGPDHYLYGRVLVGGCDDYFNSGEYRSSWTYFGRPIGTSLFTSFLPNKEGLVLGTENNRIIAHNLGISGKMAGKFPYRICMTYSKNYGHYNQSDTSRYANNPEQFSFCMEGKIPFTRLFAFNYGLYGDFGSLFQNSVAFCIGCSMVLMNN